MKSDPIEKARLQALKAGISHAADFADNYNSLSMHPYRLGDCIRVQYGLRGGTPRRNPKNGQFLAACKNYVYGAAVEKQDVLQLAQLLEPEGWAKYARNKITVAPEVTERVKASIRLAQQLLRAG